MLLTSIHPSNRIGANRVGDSSRVTDMATVRPFGVIMGTTKRCPTCGETKPVSKFCRHRSRKDGLRGQCRACSTAYYHANHSRYATYRHAHRKEKAVYDEDYQRVHCEKRLAYRVAHRTERTANRHIARARTYGDHHRYDTEAWKAQRAAWGNRCLCCDTTADLTTDHIVPLSLGGTNTLDNLQLLCRACNTRKGQKTTDYRPRRKCDATS